MFLVLWLVSVWITVLTRETWQCILAVLPYFVHFFNWLWGLLGEKNNVNCCSAFWMIQSSRNVQDRWRALPLSSCRNCCWLTLEKKQWSELFLSAFVFTLKKQLLSGMKSPVMVCNVRGSSAYWRNDLLHAVEWSHFMLLCRHFLSCRSTVRTRAVN